MKRTLAALAAVAFVLTGSSNGEPFQPSLRLISLHDRTMIFLNFDPASARLEVYAPLDYRVSLGQPAGTTIGNVTLQFTSDAVGGTVTAVDPSSVAGAAEACTGVAVHEAAWLVRTEAPAPVLDLPVFVDRITTGAASRFASLRLQLCPPTNPSLRFGDFGLSVLQTAGVLEPPATTGESLWVAVFRDSAGGVLESQAVERYPQSLALAANTVSRTIVVRKGGKRRRVRRFFAHVQGRLVAAGNPVVGASVTLTPRGIRRNPLVSSYDGRFSETIPITASTVFQAEARLSPWVISSECQPRIGERCTSVSDADFVATSPRATAVVRKR